MPRTLTEAEFERVKAEVLASAPPNMSEATFNKWAPAQLAAAVAEAELRPVELAGSAVGRFASNLGAQVNPVTIAKGLYEAVTSPVQTVRGVLTAQGAEFGKAAEAYGQGRYSEALGHGAAGLLPVLGPAAAAAGEQIGSGDVAGGLGTGVGLVGGVVAPEAIKAGVQRLPGREALARGLQAGAEQRVVDVMAPKVGRQKVRFGGMAEEVAPALVNEPGFTAWSREGLQAKVGAAFEEAKAGLDAAQDARLHARTFKTQPLIDALRAERRRLTSEAVEATGISYQQINVGGKPVTTWIKNRGPLGENVVPGPNAARVAKLDQAIEELTRLGPETRYEPLRRFRQAYDQEAKVIYSPAVTADFLTKQGTARAAANISGATREFLAGHEPATAAANARYNLMKTADDVLEATREVERVRPTLGRKMLTSFLGGSSGGALAGLPGMAIGAVVGPVLDSALSAGLTTKLHTARLMRELATALQGGNPQAVASVGARLRARLPQLGALLEQLQTAPAAGAAPAGAQTETP